LKSFDKIVTLGDSFAWGDELIAPDQTAAADYGNRFYREQHCYAGLLSRHYGVPAENLAFPGGSCQSTRWIYTWWRQRESDPASCLVLVQLSGPWRTSQFDRHRRPGPGDHDWNRFVHSAWMDHYRSHHDTAAQYFMLEQDLADCVERNSLVQAETYLFFQGQNADTAALFMFNSQIGNYDHGLMPESLLWQGRSFENILKDPNCFAPFGHLNESGHQRVADLLIKEIDRVILVE
jgi:hypothetical protein